MVIEYSINVVCCVAVILGLLVSKYWENHIHIQNAQFNTQFRYFLFVIIFLINCCTTYVYISDVINYSLIHVSDPIENMALCLCLVIMILCMSLIDIIEVDNIFRVQQPWSSDEILYHIRLLLVFIVVGLTIALFILVQILYAR